jgi:hypothetical protein
MATASDERAGKFATELEGRAIAIAASSARSNAGANARESGFALQVFGRSIRESNCDCDRSLEASLLQTVYLQNDGAVLQAIEGNRGSWIEEISKSAPRGRRQQQAEPIELTIDQPKLIRQVYLRTLSRLPTPDEVDRCTQYLAQADSPQAGAKGLLWALINTKEFIVNH